MEERSAFPYEKYKDEPGMTLREYAAVHILAGILAHSETGSKRYEGDSAMDAISFADYLLAELAKPREKK